MPDYLFFYLCHVRYGIWNSDGSAGFPVLMSPILPNTTETCLGPQVGAVPFSCPQPPSGVGSRALTQGLTQVL